MNSFIALYEDNRNNFLNEVVVPFICEQMLQFIPTYVCEF